MVKVRGQINQPIVDIAQVQEEYWERRTFELPSLAHLHKPTGWRKYLPWRKTQTPIVILRRLTNAAVSNMTAVSNAVTAQSQPSSSDFIMLMENKTGTATINTDIKAFVSRDNGSTFTQGTLVDEGTYATNTKILAFHDLDISSQPSGTQMVYKIQTFNQSSGSKETAVKAVSLGWK